jgi:DNA phosphorothioation-associated putative methyltransferase
MLSSFFDSPFGSNWPAAPGPSEDLQHPRTTALIATHPTPSRHHLDRGLAAPRQPPRQRHGRRADELLFWAGDSAAIDEACKRSPFGKLLPDDLYVHRSALDTLEPLLRVYEGCGRAYLGEVEGANVIKIHRRTGKLSYLSYPEFDDDPHPALLRSVRVNLRTRQIDCNDYSQSANPPVLHRKETFLHRDHPLCAKFARLTQQEEKHGLPTESAMIGNREGWRARLRESGLQLRGHRLVKQSDRDG